MELKYDLFINFYVAHRLEITCIMKPRFVCTMAYSTYKGCALFYYLMSHIFSETKNNSTYDLKNLQLIDNAMILGYTEAYTYIRVYTRTHACTDTHILYSVYQIIPFFIYKKSYKNENKNFYY